jgi:hypothetical protein
MKTIKHAAAIAAAILALGATTAAHAASQLFNLNVADTSANLGATVFGTVLVTEDAGALDFLVTLDSGFKFHDGNANHNAFAFELNGDPAVSITNITSGFTRVSGTNFDAPPFGNGIWDYALDCTGCGPGYGGGVAGPLSFKVAADVGSLSLASLQSNAATVNGQSYDVYFTSDLVNTGGYTGNVGATIGSAVPEPATWAMMILGFGLSGAALRGRRRVTA